MQQTDHTPPGPLKARWPEWGSKASEARRKTIARKLQIYSERHKPLIEARIDERLGKDDKGAKVSELIRRFTTASPNLARSVVDAVAVAYSRGCRRQLKDASAEESTAFASLIDETGIDRLAPVINEMAWLCGPVIVAPCISARGVVGLDVLTGDVCEVKAEDGQITAVLWRRGDGVWIELDHKAWCYYDEASKSAEPVKVVTHQVGYCPAVPFRTGLNLSDWWQVDEHSGLIDATLDVGYKLALGLWYRQVSGNKLTVIWGELEGIAPGQSIGHPALPLFMGSKLNSEVQVYDRIVSAGEYLDEIGAIISMAVARYGIPPSEITFQNNGMAWHSLAVTVRGEKLGKLRDKQVPWLRASERDLWPTICDMVRAAPHRLRRQLPNGDETRERLRLFFPDLATPDDVKARIEALTAALPYGLANPTQVILEAQPELTPEEAAEIRERNMEAEVQRLERLASRNVSGDPANGLQAIAQLHGRVGGLMSGEARREETDL